MTNPMTEQAKRFTIFRRHDNPNWSVAPPDGFVYHKDDPKPESIELIEVAALEELKRELAQQVEARDIAAGFANEYRIQNEELQSDNQRLREALKTGLDFVQQLRDQTPIKLYPAEMDDFTDQAIKALKQSAGE